MLVVDVNSQVQPDIEQRYKDAMKANPSSVRFNLPVFSSRPLGGTVWLITLEGKTSIKHTFTFLGMGASDKLEFSLFTAQNMISIFEMYKDVIQGIFNNEPNLGFSVDEFLKADAASQTNMLNFAFESIAVAPFKGLICKKSGGFTTSTVTPEKSNVWVSEVDRTAEVNANSSLVGDLADLEITFIGHDSKRGLNYVVLFYNEIEKPHEYIASWSDQTKAIHVNSSAYKTSNFANSDILMVVSDDDMDLSSNSWLTQKLGTHMYRPVNLIKGYLGSIVKAYLDSKSIKLQNKDAYFIPKELCNTAYQDFMYMQTLPKDYTLDNFLYDFIFYVGENHVSLMFDKNNGFYMQYRLHDLFDVSFFKNITSDPYLSNLQNGDVVVPLDYLQVSKSLDGFVLRREFWNLNLGSIGKTEEGSLGDKANTVAATATLLMGITKFQIKLTCNAEWFSTISNGNSEAKGLIAAYSLYRFYKDTNANPGISTGDKAMLRDSIKQAGIIEAIEDFKNTYKDNKSVMTGLNLMHKMTEPYENNYILLESDR